MGIAVQVGFEEDAFVANFCQGIQAKYLKPVIGIHKVQGKPFKSVELEEKLEVLLNQKVELV